MSKKVLIVGWGYPPKIDGGLDIVVKELFEELQKRENIEADLLLPEDRAPDKENIISVKVEGDMMSKARQLSRAAAENASKYDIIHTTIGLELKQVSSPRNIRILNGFPVFIL